MEVVREGAGQLLVVVRRPAETEDTVGVPAGGRYNPQALPRTFSALLPCVWVTRTQPPLT